MGLTPEQQKIFWKFTGYFGDPEESGYLFIPTGRHPRTGVPLLNSYGEKLIAMAVQAGLVDSINDGRCTRTEDASGDAVVVVKGDPSGGISILFEYDVVDFIQQTINNRK